MEHLFDPRVLLSNTTAYDYAEGSRATKAEKQLMATDPFDIKLEDRLNDVLKDKGVELWGPKYDKAVSDLQGYYLKNRKDGLGYVSAYDFGQPCGASYISSAYVCRVGLGSGLDYKRASSAEQVDALEEKYAAFEASIAGYSPEAQAGWKDMVKSSIDELNSPDQRTDLTDEKAAKYYDRIITKAKVMADDGPPTKITNKVGEEVPMSDKIMPVMSRTGNMAWYDPVMGMSYTKRSAGDMELEQNRASLTENIIDGRVKGAVARYDQYQKSPTLQAKGEFGSPSMAQQRVVPQKEIDERWSKLSVADKRNVAFSGVDSVGGRPLPGGGIDPRSEHRAFYERHPDLLEARGKEVLGAYLAQTPAPNQPARSAFTNQEIPLPGTFGPGGRATVDHYVPLSSGYPKQTTKPWSREEGMSVLTGRDSRANIVIVENGLNTSKGKREDWDRQIIPGWRNKQAEYEKRIAKVDKMPSYQTGAKGATPKKSSRTTASTARVKAQRAEQKVARTKTKAESGARKTEAKLEKYRKDVSKARADRDKYKPGSAAWTKRNAKVSALRTEQRRFEKEQGII